MSAARALLAAAWLASAASAQDLGRYVDECKAVSGIDAKATAAVRARLEREVGLVVTPNRHLAPARYQRGIGGNPILYGNPAELVYALLRARNHVSPPLQTKIDAYVKREMAEYPLWEFAWVSDGERREWWRPPPDRIDKGNQTGAPAINLYVLWYYARQTGDAKAIAENWQKVKGVCERIPAPDAATYGHVAGLIGTARLAALLGKAAEHAAARKKAIAAMRGVLAKGFVRLHAEAEKRFADQGHRWYFVPFHYRRDNRGNGRTGAFYCPEIGRILRENDKAGVHADVKARLLDGAGLNTTASWYLTYGDQPYGGRKGVGGENNTMGPDYSWAIYMLYADVIGASPRQLARWLDIPFVQKGDSYCILRMARAIEAHGTETWRRCTPAR